MSQYDIKPLFPKKMNQESLRTRPGKVKTQDFADVWPPSPGFKSFLKSFPKILAGKDFTQFIETAKKARSLQKPVILAMGAHVIKVGLSPIIIDLLQSGWISGLAMNGAGIIHDFEIAFSGSTSEDVEETIRDGRFGTAEETGRFLNQACIEGARENLGLGESIGRMIHTSDFPHKNLSLLAAAYSLNIPVTVHVALGTDIIHFHPDISGEALGKTSMQDFYLFCSMIKNLDSGGLFINVGSAVLLPEVFLKAVSYIRNSGSELKDFSTAVFDFNHHYRPYQNVVKRPIKGNGRGFYFIGHHEIMLPLVAAALKA